MLYSFYGLTSREYSRAYYPFKPRGREKPSRFYPSGRDLLKKELFTTPVIIEAKLVRYNNSFLCRVLSYASDLLGKVQYEAIGRLATFGVVWALERIGAVRDLHIGRCQDNE
jgi:hypothetical protein